MGSQPFLFGDTTFRAESKGTTRSLPRNLGHTRGYPSQRKAERGPIRQRSTHVAVEVSLNLLLFSLTLCLGVFVCSKRHQCPCLYAVTFRALRFTSLGLRENLQNEQEELSVSMSRAYDNSLKQFHGWLVRPIFKASRVGGSRALFSTD